MKAILIRARELIEQGWCRNAWARNELGKGVHENSSDACSWCLMGAINKAIKEKGYTYGIRLDISSVCKTITLNGLIHFNDNAKSKEEVTGLIDRMLETI